jgi:hypothetical protein
MTPRSTLLSRLAIALLAICGFIVSAPAERQFDEAAESRVFRREAEVVEAVTFVAASCARVVAAPITAPARVELTARRFLLHRALLI